MTLRKLYIVVAAVALTVFPAFGSSILSIGLFDTGTNSSGVVLSGGSVDPHYLLGTANSYVVSDVPGAWVPNNTQSAWISFQSTVQTITQTTDVSYTYTTTFNLTVYVLSSVIITGGWATDNSAVMSLNGTQVTTIANVGNDPFDNLHTFTLNSGNGLVLGTNTLTFVVTNVGAPLPNTNPTGLRVQYAGITGTPSGGEIPEPGTLALLGGGLLAVGILRRRY